MTVRFREKRTRFRVAVEGVVVDDVVDAMLLNSDVVRRLVQVDGGDVVEFCRCSQNVRAPVLPPTISVWYPNIYGTHMVCFLLLGQSSNFRLLQ